MDCDDGVRRGLSGAAPKTITTATSYAITKSDMVLSGGHVTVKESGSSAPIDITLPAPLVGHKVTIIKTRASTDAVAALGSGGAKVHGSNANKRYQNVTSGLGSVTLQADGTDWFAVAQTGTWAVSNA